MPFSFVYNFPPGTVVSLHYPDWNQYTWTWSDRWEDVAISGCLRVTLNEDCPEESYNLRHVETGESYTGELKYNHGRCVLPTKGPVRLALKKALRLYDEWNRYIQVDEKYLVALGEQHLAELYQTRALLLEPESESDSTPQREEARTRLLKTRARLAELKQQFEAAFEREYKEE